LLEGIIPKIFEPKNIQQIDRIQLLSSCGIEGFLNFVNDELEHCIVDRLTNGIAVTYTASLTVGLKAHIFMHYLLLLQ
jgi:hypothetical protein